MGDYKPQIPRIYERMERGEIPQWLGLTVIFATWVFVIVPALCLTSPVWGSVAVVNWLRGPRPKITAKPQVPSSS